MIIFTFNLCVCSRAPVCVCFPKMEKLPSFFPHIESSVCVCVCLFVCLVPLLLLLSCHFHFKWVKIIILLTVIMGEQRREECLILNSVNHLNKQCLSYNYNCTQKHTLICLMKYWCRIVTDDGWWKNNNIDIVCNLIHNNDKICLKRFNVPLGIKRKSMPRK